MRFLCKINLLLIVSAAAALPQTVKTTDEVYARVREVGQKLKCQCGAQCSYTVASCNMLHCSFREKVNPEIRAGVEAGLSTDTIVENLIAKYGSALRNAPRAEGFGAVGWAMPFVALLIGLIVAPIVVVRWQKRHKIAAVASASNAPVSEAVVARYRDRIERDLAELE